MSKTTKQQTKEYDAQACWLDYYSKHKKAMKSKRIPEHPHMIYKNFVSYVDWLGWN